MLTWALVTLGLIYFVTEASIFAPVRVAIARRHALLAQLIYCPACSGFWIGLGMHVVWGTTISPYDWTLFDSWRATALFESSVAGMALGAVWGTWHHNVAWDAEEPLREKRAS